MFGPCPPCHGGQLVWMRPLLRRRTVSARRARQPLPHAPFHTLARASASSPHTRAHATTHACTHALTHPKPPDHTHNHTHTAPLFAHRAARAARHGPHACWAPHGAGPAGVMRTASPAPHAVHTRAGPGPSPQLCAAAGGRRAGHGRPEPPLAMARLRYGPHGTRSLAGPNRRAECAAASGGLLRLIRVVSPQCSHF